MTIQEMLEREDIYSILSTTLEEYFLTVRQEKVTVRVDNSRLKNRFVVYPRLGIVCSRFPSWKVAKDLYTQFNVQGNVIKKLVAWGYITACFLTFGLLSSCSLFVGNKNWCKRNIYIMPCNRKIRIFDYGKGYVDAILKTGFSDVCFKNEMKYRVKPQFDFIPPVIEHGDRWYRERIIEGVGLVRVKEPDYTRYCQEVLDDAKLMYQQTLHYEPIDAYYTRIADEIKKAFPKLKEEKNIATTDYIETVLDRIKSFTIGRDNNVPLVLSHGDLQTGNVMVENATKKVSIYDWETAGERSVWFDMGKLMLHSQRKGRYAYMIEHRDDDEVKEKLLTFDDKKDYPMAIVISILVLEELKFFVDEIIDLPGAIGTEIMDRLTDELKQTLLFK